nr:putative virion core protein P4a [Wadden Sea poxvirus]
MMPIDSVITLDQLEDSEYLFRVISTVIPSLCLDYKVCDKLKTTYIHPFDILLNTSLGKYVDKKEIENSIEKIGINYLLDTYSNLKLFRAVINPGVIDQINIVSKTNEENNQIINTHTFNDLPTFTRDLINIRLKEPEYKARFIGGYIKPEKGGYDILTPVSLPDLNFKNTYIMNLIYKNVLNTNIHGFKARLLNGILLARDFENLLGIRSLLSQSSRARFDIDFNIDNIAQDHNVTINRNPVVNTDILTMKSFKHLLMYYQYFSTHYTLTDLNYNNETILNTRPDIPSIIASMRFQSQIPRLLDLYPDLTVYDNATVTTKDTLGNVTVSNMDITGFKIVDISSKNSYFITLLNMLAKESRSQILTSDISLFWDGYDYDEYKNKKLSDILFYNTTCYVFGLYNKNGITYCSILSDIIAYNEKPIRVCLLPRVVGGKTVPNLIAETLNSINNASHKDFPKKSPLSVPMHIGLSERGFMRFFQLLRLMTNKTPEISIKEVLLAYAGFKIDDSGSPYIIRKESYQDFSILLFSSMGFKVTIHKSIIGSNNYTTIIVRPRVTKQYINNMLIKSNCSKEEADKLISTTWDLLNFMVSAGDPKDYHSYRYMRNFTYPRYLFYGGYTNESDDNISSSEYDKNIHETIIQISEPMSMLDRINTRGIFSATTTDEMLGVDAFMPENIAFKNNITNLINNEQLCGESILHVMPLNILDRIITTAGSCKVSIGELMDNILPNNEDCNATNEVTELINNALKDNYSRDSNALVTHTINSVAARSQNQLNEVKQYSCQMALIFKNLVKSIYTMERIFQAKISDEVKSDILEKYKTFAQLSKSLYQDLISIENLKAMLYIIKRSGRQIDDIDIGPDELRKSYDVIKPKIINMTNYYTEMSKSYFDYMKKNLNMLDSDMITFDIE